MSSGGARGRSGPAPNPDALRRDRPSDIAGWTTLPSQYDGTVPAWPIQPEISPSEKILWDQLWKTPQASEWAKNGLGQAIEVALYVRVLDQAQRPAAAIGLVKEARLMAEHLGLSSVGLDRNKWRLTADGSPSSTPAATATKTRPARTTPSARDRFRVVPDTEG